MEIGVEYDVFALRQRDGIWFATFEHHKREMPVSAPLGLFEVIDARVDVFWTVKVTDASLSLQPIEFDDEFFCDDVQERRNGAIDLYRAMKQRLKSNAS